MPTFPSAARVAVLTAFCLVAGGAGCADSAPAPLDAEASGRPLGGAGYTGTMRLGTTPELAAVVRRQASDFEKLYPQATITVVESTARAAVVGVLRGTLDAAVVDRTLNAEETGLAEENRLNIGQTLIGEGAVVAIVPSASPVRALPVETLRSLLAGRAVAWASVDGGGPGQVRLVLTDRNAGTVEFLARRLLRDGALPQSAIRAATEADVLARVAGRSDAVGVVSALTVRADTAARVRTLALVDSAGRTVSPSPLAVYTDEYPLRQPVVLVTGGARGGVAAGFATFVLGTQGQEAVQRAGLVPARPPVREFDLD